MTTATDFFCGAGGSSTGLVAAGITVKHAANHWKLAIDTHNTNHPHTDHSLDDLQQAHPSWYPRTDIAWFSPECTNHSLAKGRKRKGIGQLDLWGDNQVDPAEERSRATMREVVEFSAYHNYQVVIVENVVDIRHWQFYEEWLRAMINLGYDYRVLYLNAQFFGVPQSRDRFYAVFWKRGNHAPDLDFCPDATCTKHGAIKAVQVFKKTEFQWGRYGSRRQYTYRCPQCGADVQPSFRPAADVIDWALPSEKIGDRKKPLREKTLQRVLAGLKKFGTWPHIADLSHSHAEHNGKVQTVASPLSTETTQLRHALVQPFITSQHLGRDAVRTVDREMPCITTMNNEHQLVVPPYLIVQRCTDTKDGVTNPISLDEPMRSLVTVAQHVLITPPFIAELRNNSDVRSVDNPLSTITTTGSHHALVTPFVMAYYGSEPTYASAKEPLPTMTTVQRHALITPEDLLPECGFRMLEPNELKRGMSFPDEYIVLGSKRDQVRQIGNAVCANVAQWIGERVVASLQ